MHLLQIWHGLCCSHLQKMKQDILINNKINNNNYYYRCKKKRSHHFDRSYFEIKGRTSKSNGEEHVL